VKTLIFTVRIVNSIKGEVKKKVKLALEQDTKAQKGRRGIVLLFL
jgi:hypothetical protein